MTMAEVTAVAAGILLVAGALLIALGAFGLVRLPDALCRSHAATKALTLGIALMLGGLWLMRTGTAATSKIALALVFQVISIPVASHLLALAAHAHRLPRFKAPGARTRQRPPRKGT
jgi:multicomponent Na+:H+ antiporter subunit G